MRKTIMGKAIIQFQTKNHSLFGNSVEISTDFIPRVGELIDAGQFLEISKDEVSNFIVESVIYRLTDDGLVPHISARQWMKGYRHELLERRGWLPVKDTGMLEYDESDPAIHQWTGAE